MSIYQGILMRGGNTVGEMIACKKLANYYRSGRFVEKDIDYAIKLENKANESFEEINEGT
ncbi:hypothetical protein [Aliikangiella sp. G2MR2-5]|uniref:hypothetical protein n=1 Tax=Aliikangiella sp. G2MR2-5 TaxID=2788943 RepID=UPI0018A990D8|nr:hypothetical protein [Aliikangiella sp. G2MR2-5]